MQINQGIRTAWASALKDIFFYLYDGTFWFFGKNSFKVNIEGTRVTVKFVHS